MIDFSEEVSGNIVFRAFRNGNDYYFIMNNFKALKIYPEFDTPCFGQSVINIRHEIIDSSYFPGGLIDVNFPNIAGQMFYSARCDDNEYTVLFNGGETKFMIYAVTDVPDADGSVGWLEEDICYNCP